MRRINTRLLLVIGIAVSLLWVVFVWFQTSRLLEDTGQQIAAFTVTYYKSTDVLRFDLAVRLCREAERHQHTLFVVDGSPEPVHQELRRFCPNVHRQTTGSRGGAIREGIQHCLQHMEPRGGVVLWQEPEKVDLVRWYRTIARPLWHSEAHIVVPVRQAKAFQETYPKEQYHAESYGNLMVNAFAAKRGLTASLDWFFGPVAFLSDKAPHWLEYQGTAWDAQMVPILHAYLKEGAKILGVEIDYRHSPLMKAQEDGDTVFGEKRLMQLNLLVPALKKEWLG